VTAFFGMVGQGFLSVLLGFLRGGGLRNASTPTVLAHRWTAAAYPYPDWPTQRIPLARCSRQHRERSRSWLAGP